MRYGVSMFGLGPVFLKNKDAFLKQITDAGYCLVEPCVIAQEIPQLKNHFWTFSDLEVYYPLLHSFGLEICSLHVYPQNLSKERQELIALAKKYGVTQLVIPCPQFESLEQGMKLARELTAEADLMQSEGIELLLHNGRADSSARIDGISAYERLLRQCGENVGAQADVGWLLYGGIDPEEFLWRNQKRVRSLHYKDMENTSDGMIEIGVGRGLVDMSACFRFAMATDTIQLVDQDGSRGDFLEDLDFVADYFLELSRGGHQENK